MLHLANDPDILLALLEQTAGRLDITIRYEPILGATNQSHSPGGLCRLKDRNLLIVDASLNAGQKCAVIADNLRRFDLGDIFVPPLVRHLLERDDLPPV